MQPAEVVRTPQQPHISGQDRLGLDNGLPTANQWRQGRAEGDVEPLDKRRVDPSPGVGGGQHCGDGRLGPVRSGAQCAPRAVGCTV